MAHVRTNGVNIENADSYSLLVMASGIRYGNEN